MELCLYGGGLMSKFASNIWEIGSAMQMGIFFYYGFYLRGMKIHPKFCLVMLSIIVGMVSGCIFLFMDNKIVVKLAGVLFTFTELYLIYCLGIVTVEAKIFKTRIWQELSRTSYDIFLIHQQIIYFCIFLFHPRLNMYTTIGCSFFVAMSISWLICKGWGFALKKGV